MLHLYKGSGGRRNRTVGALQNKKSTVQQRGQPDSTLGDPVRVASILRNDTELANIYRPRSFSEVVGRKREKEILKVMIQAVRSQWESGQRVALDHILFYGPPGVGKTTLAFVIAKELGVDITVTSGPAIERAADLVAILTNLKAGDILFIDEIHRLKKPLEEILYIAMEDYKVDIVAASQGDGQAIRIDLEPFTLVAATTKIGALSAPLRDRFGLSLYLDLLDDMAVLKLLRLLVSKDPLGVSASDEALREIARRSRGTPRVAIRLYKRVRDYLVVSKHTELGVSLVRNVLDRLGIDSLGLDYTDRMLLRVIVTRFNGGPIGLKSLAAALGEDATTIEEVYEPYLIKAGLLVKTSRGRMITKRALEHLGIEPRSNGDNITA